MDPDEKILSLGYATRSRLEEGADTINMKFLAATTIDLSDQTSPSSENTPNILVKLYYLTPTGQIAEVGMMFDTNDPKEIGLELFRQMICHQINLSLEKEADKISPEPHLN